MADIYLQDVVRRVENHAKHERITIRALSLIGEGFIMPSMVNPTRSQLVPVSLNVRDMPSYYPPLGTCSGAHTSVLATGWTETEEAQSIQVDISVPRS